MNISITQVSRELRKNQTSEEKILWEHLRNRKLRNQKFVRQYPIYFECDEQKGFYVADFCCISRQLVIELDGGVHLQQQERDEFRDQICSQLGYTVLRFPNKRLLSDMESVLREITNHLR